MKRGRTGRGEGGGMKKEVSTSSKAPTQTISLSLSLLLHFLNPPRWTNAKSTLINPHILLLPLQEQEETDKSSWHRGKKVTAIHINVQNTWFYQIFFLQILHCLILIFFWCVCVCVSSCSSLLSWPSHPPTPLIKEESVCAVQYNTTQTPLW